jgi:Flp pilus assembly pilin Flp
VAQGKSKMNARSGTALRKEVAHMGDFCAFLKEEDGVTVVEIILVLLVLIALVLIFKEQLTKVVKSILSKVSSQADSV